MSFFDDAPNNNVTSLITCENGAYRVNEETLAWIETQTEPFSVIACAGKYRTGKSFLLNRLANADPNVGFGVGDSVQACTKGLWLFKEFFDMDGKKVLILDTEGIDALDANDTHDVRIFTLALLLCNSFLYNSVGTIDETAMQTLSLMTRVTENVRVSSESQCSSEELATHMPNFYWVLRDFSLQLVDKSGKSITEAQYLEEALQTTDRAKTQVRDTVREMFPRRKLVTLPRPSSDDGSVQNLERKLHGLTNKFTKALQAFRSELVNSTPVMMAQGAPMTGRMYATLIRHLANVVQSDAVPVIRDSWSLMAAVQARDLRDAIVREFEEWLTMLMPRPRPKLEEVLAERRRLLLERFRKECMRPLDEECLRAIEERTAQLSDDRLRKLVGEIDRVVEQSFADVEPRILETPENMSKILEDAQQAFLREFEDDPEFANLWRVTASDRALCRWIPMSLKNLASQRDDAQERCERLDGERARLQEEAEASVAQAREENATRLRELEQEIESQSEGMRFEEARARELEQSLCLLQCELRAQELAMSELRALQHEASREAVETSQDGEGMPDASAQLERLTLANAQLMASLEELRLKHQQSCEQAQQHETKLAKALEVHARLESSWKSGLAQLKEGHQRTIKQIREEFDEKAATQTKQLERLQSQIEEGRLREREQEITYSALETKHSHALDIHEKEKTQLQQASQRYREQSESAASRVLEIHRTMLDDLRARDEKNRVQQASFLKERNEIQIQMTDITGQLERERSTALDLKRRIGELELVEREHKCLKLTQQENSFHITRLEAENAQLRDMERKKSDELERIRNDNMNMEGELAVLRAEKQLYDANCEMNATV